MIFFLVIFLLSCLYLLSFTQIKSSWLKTTQQKNSIVNTIKPSFGESLWDTNFYELGLKLAKFLPNKFIETEEFIYKFLQKDPRGFYINIAKALLVMGFTLVVFLFLQNWFLLLAGVLVLIYFIFDSRFLYQTAIKELDSSVKHIVQCLDILLIKSETPIITALELIYQELDSKYIYTKNELKKIITQASKTGLSQSLRDFHAYDYGLRLKEFFSLLISVNEGASKKAISEQINNFLELQNQEAIEDQKALVENLQLYLILPVILMLLIIMFPMADAIMYSLNSTGFSTTLIKN